MMTRPYVYPVPFLWGVVAVVLSGEGDSELRFGFAIFLPLFGWVTAQLYNDYKDVEIDKINYPYRPLPSGLLSCRFVAITIIVNSVAGSLIVLILQPKALVLAAVITFLGLLYSKSKRHSFMGPLTLATIFFAIPLFSSYFYALRIPLILLVFAFDLFLIEVGCNILGGFQDIGGDAVKGVRTVVVKQGVERSIYYVAVAFVGAAVVTLVPVFLVYNIFSGIIYLIFLILISAAVAVLIREPEKSGGNKALKLVRLVSIFQAGVFLTLKMEPITLITILLMSIIFNLAFTSYFEAQSQMV